MPSGVSIGWVSTVCEAMVDIFYLPQLQFRDVKVQIRLDLRP